MTKRKQAVIPVAQDTVSDDIAKAYDTIIKWFNRDGKLNEAELENFNGSALRAAKALKEMYLSKTEIIEELTKLVNVSFPNPAASNNSLRSIVSQGRIALNSLCPHHLLPIRYELFIAYLPLPEGKVLGLSKISRIAITLAKRPVLQEQLAEDIADVFFGNGSMTYPSIKTEGSAVQLVGHHNCMACRGVMSAALTMTTAVRGVFENSDMEEKFYNNVEQLRRCSVV